MNPYGECCICHEPFKKGDQKHRIQIIKCGIVAEEEYDYCPQCYSIHIEKND